VLVTHWWEYFPNFEPDEVLIEKLHRTAAYLADDPEIKVIAFSDPGRDESPAELSLAEGESSAARQ